MHRILSYKTRGNKNRTFKKASPFDLFLHYCTNRSEQTLQYIHTCIVPDEFSCPRRIYIYDLNVCALYIRYCYVPWSTFNYTGHTREAAAGHTDLMKETQWMTVKKRKREGKSKRFVCVCVWFQNVFLGTSIINFICWPKANENDSFFLYIICRNVCIRSQCDIIQTFVLPRSIIAIYFHQSFLSTAWSNQCTLRVSSHNNRYLFRKKTFFRSFSNVCELIDRCSCLN